MFHLSKLNRNDIKKDVVKHKSLSRRKSPIFLSPEIVSGLMAQTKTNGFRSSCTYFTLRPHPVEQISFSRPPLDTQKAFPGDHWTGHHGCTTDQYRRSTSYACKGSF
ncbi:hypothetical protein NPIL_20641 [Nephila pilipes]|uniref:Uncharacterized protein n=1 Tax=Nephila pilipes TaxID=299642 RepID=A0A8X6Q835_NEPPI|nr:hypothetical protein NPIL_20641 [Nephila pilipes]